MLVGSCICIPRQTLSVDSQKSSVQEHCHVQLLGEGQNTELSPTGRLQHSDSTFSSHGWYHSATTKQTNVSGEPLKKQNGSKQVSMQYHQIPVESVDFRIRLDLILAKTNGTPRM